MLNKYYEKYNLIPNLNKIPKHILYETYYKY